MSISVRDLKIIGLTMFHFACIATFTLSRYNVLQTTIEYVLVFLFILLWYISKIWYRGDYITALFLWAITYSVVYYIWSPHLFLIDRAATDDLDVILLSVNGSDRYVDVENWVKLTGLTYRVKQDEKFKCHYDVDPSCVIPLYIRTHMVGYVAAWKVMVDTDLQSEWSLFLEDDAAPIVSINRFKQHLFNVISRFKSYDIIWLDNRNVISNIHAIFMYGGIAGVLINHRALQILSERVLVPSEFNCKLEINISVDDLMNWYCNNGYLKCIPSAMVKEDGRKSLRVRKDGRFPNETCIL